MMMKKTMIYIGLFLILFQKGMADINVPKSAEDDAAKILASIEQCKKFKSYLIRSKFPVECDGQYLHFGPTSKTTIGRSTFRLANYNLLHPGTSKTLFKDYALMAKVMNTFDLIAAQELLSVIGHDADVNTAIDDYLNNPNLSAAEILSAKSIYRMPGYLKILLELKKLDPSWSLLLSPRGDAAILGSVEEFVGYFYRASVVKLKTNKYCEENVKSKSNLESFGCIINLGVKNKYISRRPFMASFTIGKTNLTLVSSHIVFNFNGDDEAQTDLVKNVFGANSLEEVGKGVNVVNFARVAEVKMIMEFIKKYSLKYNDSKVIFSADTNLNPDIEYWNDINAINNSTLLVNDPTTLSPQRYNKAGEETLGQANSYDHFLLNKNSINSCDDGQVINYVDSEFGKEIEKNYLIRKNSINLSSKKGKPYIYKDDLFDNENPNDETPPTKLDYPLTKAGEQRMNSFAQIFEQQLLALKTIKNDQIVSDEFQITERIDGLKNRLFLKQLTNSFYYRVYQELLSDHFPAYLTCKF